MTALAARSISQSTPRARTRSTRNTLLWIAQSLLALTFLATGTMKLVLPLAVLTAQMHVPGAFIRILGVLEFAGALGLVLPGIFHTRTRLTPLAAAGLVIIMAGATSATMITMGVLPATGPFALGIVAGLIAVGRWNTSSF
jgi:uncharacterized membrane protein YphA (DoxX/SURF4 family)